MKSLYINIILGVVALIAVAFGAYEYGLSHPGAGARPQGAPAAGQAPALTVKATDGSWQIRCRTDAPDKCIGAMNVANKGGQLVMVWLVGASQAGGLVLTIQTPTGVVLEPGLDFALDANAAHHMAFGACGPATCRANLVLDGAILDEMRKATKATASYVLAAGRKVTYTVPVSGSDKMIGDLLPTATAPAAAATPNTPTIIK